MEVSYFPYIPFVSHAVAMLSLIISFLPFISFFSSHSTFFHSFCFSFSTFSASLFNKVLGNFIASKTIPQGAATTVYACVCPGIGTDAVSLLSVL